MCELDCAPHDDLKNELDGYLIMNNVSDEDVISLEIKIISLFSLLLKLNMFTQFFSSTASTEYIHLYQVKLETK